jgi:acyl-CoA dehydrogenase
MTTDLDRDTAFLADVRHIAAGVAAAHADEVDRAGRFPVETIDALRQAGTLWAATGEDVVTVRALAGACAELARACSSSAMIFAMHQI